MDCQQQILEELDLFSLISVSELNEQLTNIAAGILQKKFAKKSLNLPSRSHSGTIKSADISENSFSITIKNVQLLLKVLDKFGYLVKTLKIEHLSPHEISSIYEYINLYCSETLEQIDFTMRDHDFFNAFTMPFKNVQRVSIIGKPDQWTNPKLSFSEMFPALQELNLVIHPISDASWFDHVFPHLERIRFDVMSSSRNSYDEVLENIIRKNRQIRSLYLTNASLKLLKFLADETQIEVLGIHRLENNSNVPGTEHDIHFANLKVLKVQVGFDKLPENIGIENLEEFQTDGYSEGSKWIKFIERNKNLKSLYVTRHCITNEELTRISIANLNMREINAALHRDVEDQTIVDFIKSGKNLQKLHFPRYFDLDIEKGKSFMTTMHILRQELKNEWNVQEYSEDIILERKPALLNRLRK